jgi:hypothetical protein
METAAGARSRPGQPWSGDGVLFLSFPYRLG